MTIHPPISSPPCSFIQIVVVECRSSDGYIKVMKCCDLQAMKDFYTVTTAAADLILIVTVCSGDATPIHFVL